MRKRARETEETLGAQGIFSTEALQRAWRIVRRNGATPGVDRVTMGQFERELESNLAQLRQELLSGRYEPQPVRRVLVPKRKGGLRPLAIWTLRDRVAQRVVHDYLVTVVEPRFLDCSYGFRPGRSVTDAVQTITSARDANRRWVVDADIEDCFGSLDHGQLMRRVHDWVPERAVVALIEKWLRARIYNPARGQPARAAASQGGVITPLLANVYLHSFDARIMQAVPYGTLVRFADDFVILCRRRREAETALATARQALGRLLLELNPHKTRLVHFDEGFKFLGVFFLRDEHFYL
jgi:group II intron reverse transcriptase/maturase